MDEYELHLEVRECDYLREVLADLPDSDSKRRILAELDERRFYDPYAGWPGDEV
jgi:hypothetical protein